MSSFTHLHCHSHYSLLDGLPKIDELIAKAKEYKMTALALTDHGVLYGAIEFYEKCLAAGLKPIIGLEAYLAYDKLTNKRPHIDNKRYHLTLLAKNLEGYHNLIKLSTTSHLDGFYYKPRVDKEALKKYSAGLIALSGCAFSSEINQTLVNFGLAKAQTLFKEYQNIFGPENFFLEIQHYPELAEALKIRKLIIELAQATGAPLVATADSHYLDPQDKEAHEILLCVQTNAKINDPKRLSMRDAACHFKSPAEMAKDFADAPQALANTQKIADQCNLEIPLGRWIFPAIELPADQTADQHLKELADRGLAEKTALNQQTSSLLPTYQQRLDYELDIIKQKGYAAYFLIVADFANWARSQNIIATTRGSASGSLVSYAIGITTVDPMNFNLPFERFLNPYRPSPPDIDMDFEDTKRDEVLKYVRQKYSDSRVAQIVTFGTMMARGAARDVGRALGLPYSLCDRVAKMIPFGRAGAKMTLANALKENPELNKLYQEQAEIKKLLNLSQRVEGCARHASVHAAGMVITPTALTDYTPLQREAKENKIITQYEMHSLEAIGLLKMDFLGIRNLSILGLAIKIISKTHNRKIDLTNLPLNDRKTYKMLARGETMGLFQLAGSGMTRYLKELKPSNIFDIMAMIALYRPGPLESIPEFIARKHNPAKIKYLDERLKEILKSSYGIITYQDDVLLTAIQIAGYTWEEADKLRKAMGKKIPMEMAAQKAKFIAGCLNCGKTSEETAVLLWQLIEPFAAYGFNKSHAASYAMVAFQTAYVKAHFPAEYLAALMTCESGDIDKIKEAVAESQRLGIPVLAPDINESFNTFGVIWQKDSQGRKVKPSIRFSLNAIKNVGSHIVEIIYQERKKNGQYQSLEGFLTRIKDKDLNKKSLESLIKAGCFDQFSERNQLLQNIDRLLKFSKDQKNSQENKVSLFAGTAAADNLNKLYLPPVQAATAPEKSIWEKDLLGIYVSQHPLLVYAPVLQKMGFLDIKNIKTNYQQQNRDLVFHDASQDDGSFNFQPARDNNSFKIAGIVSSIKKILTKKNEPMLFVKIEDSASEVECLVFPRLLEQTADLWQENELVVIEGKKSNKDSEIKILIDKAWRLKDIINNQIDLIQSSCEPTNGQDRPIKAPANEKIVIHLSPEHNQEILLKLKNIFLSSPGSRPVYLVSPAKDKKVRLNLQTNGSGELVKQIKDLIGQESVKVM